MHTSRLPSGTRSTRRCRRCHGEESIRRSREGPFADFPRFDVTGDIAGEPSRIAGTCERRPGVHPRAGAYARVLCNPSGVAIRVQWTGHTGRRAGPDGAASDGPHRRIPLRSRDNAGRALPRPPGGPSRSEVFRPAHNVRAHQAIRRQDGGRQTNSGFQGITGAQPVRTGLDVPRVLVSIDAPLAGGTYDDVRNLRPSVAFMNSDTTDSAATM